MDDVLTLADIPEDDANKPDLEPTYEPVVQCEARFEIDPIPGGKRFQGSWLVLDDSRRYVLSYRPIPEYYPFVDKRVSVTGRPYTPGRDTQHIHAKHFQVISIELAPGEIPYEELPTELPTPPLLYSADALRERNGRWGQVVGQLIDLKDDPDTHFNIAFLKLEDGTEITAHYAAESQWRPFLGSTVTVVSRIEVGTADMACEEDEVVLTGWYAVCLYED